MFINLRLWTRLQARLRGRTVMPVEGASRAPGSGPLLYAIGDIHGCCRELDQLHHLILADVTERTMGQDRPVVLIYLGDYIDRGPDSRGVIARLLQPPPVPGAQRIFLKGNHEEALLDFLIDPEAAAGWLDFGGLETLSSYGVQQKGGGTLWRQKLGESLRVLLPPDHKAFFETLRDRWTYGDYGFAHAGIRPGRPWDAQLTEDLLWIREPFLSSRARFEKRIVHGHTISEGPEVRPHRIGIDTGAYSSGILTCLVLEDGKEPAFIQTFPP